MDAGQRLGRYRLAQRIGEGGMGVVHLGLDDAGTAVAIKVLRPHVAGDPEARRRLAREVESLRRVRHPRVAEVLDADPEGETPYLVTQFVPGPALDEHVRQHGPLDDAALARLGDGLGQALAAIHAAGIVHRDLKPGNVLMLDGDPVVIDFGIAHVADDVRLTSTGLVMGTPGYLSPELVAGSEVAQATDWWGWAATMAFAATGRPPFGRGPMHVVLDRVSRGVADLEGVPAVLVPVLQAALSVDPARRPKPAVLRVAIADLAAGRAPRGMRTVAAHGAAHSDVMPFLRDGAVTPVSVRGAEPATEVVEVTSVEAATEVVASVRAVELRDDAATSAVASGHATRRLPAEAPPVVHRAAPAAYVPPVGYAPRPVAAQAPNPYATNGFGAGAVNPSWPSTYPPASPPPPPPAPRTRGRLLVAAYGLALAAVASVAPFLAVTLALLSLLVTRTTDRTVGSMLRRRYERGVRRGDGARAAVGVPGHLLMALLVTVPTTVLPLLVGVSVAFIVGLAAPSGPAPGEAIPLFAAAASATVTAWWGPGGGSVRRGSRAIGRRAVPSRAAATVLVSILLLVLVAAVSAAVARGFQPDWTPLDGPPFSELVLP